MAEVSGWTLRGVNVLGELLGSLDMCHHPSVGQILTTTDAPLSHLQELVEGKSGERSESEGFLMP